MRRRNPSQPAVEGLDPARRASRWWLARPDGKAVIWGEPALNLLTTLAIFIGGRRPGQRFREPVITFACRAGRSGEDGCATVALAEQRRAISGQVEGLLRLVSGAVRGRAPGRCFEEKAVLSRLQGSI
jgi:hypothetical protein